MGTTAVLLSSKVLTFVKSDIICSLFSSLIDAISRWRTAMSLYTRLATALDIASRVMGSISYENKAMLDLKLGLSLAKTNLCITSKYWRCSLIGGEK